MSSRTTKKKLDAPCFVFATLYNCGRGLLGNAHSCTFAAPIAMPGRQRRTLPNILICLVVLVTAMSMLPALLLCRMAHWSILGITNCNGWPAKLRALSYGLLFLFLRPCHSYDSAFLARTFLICTFVAPISRNGCWRRLFCLLFLVLELFDRTNLLQAHAFDIGGFMLSS